MQAVSAGTGEAEARQREPERRPVRLRGARLAADRFERDRRVDHGLDGGMTKRLDRLERAGLIRRDTCEDDRRSLWILLAPKGRKLVDEALEVHFENEERVLAGVPRRDRDRLARVLREPALSLDRG